jgi:parallel beta-helix repeat protein
VPQQYATIQAAVNAAQEGDTVRVAAGTYAERVLISDKAITLAGAGAEQTTIDATHAGRPLTVSTTGSGQVTVSGFTLTNGKVDDWTDASEIAPGQGGGVYAEYTNLALRNNVVTHNLGCLGTSVGTLEATMTMTRNRIEHNPGNHDCGQQSVIIRANRGAESTVSGNVIQDHNITGLQLQGAGKVTVSNNIFRNNVADWANFGLEHGGLLSLYTELTLTNNLFTGNYGYGAGAAYVTESENDAPVRITGNSFVGNSSGVGPSALDLLSLSAPENTIVKGNQFDESTDARIIECALGILVDGSNVFASDRAAALSGACVAAE